MSKETLKSIWEGSLYMPCQANIMSEGLEQKAPCTHFGRTVSLNLNSHRQNPLATNVQKKITQVRRAQIVGVHTRAAESVVTRCQGPSSLVYEIHNRYLEIQ